MCTGFEIAALAAAAVGTGVAVNQAQQQADAAVEQGKISRRRRLCAGRSPGPGRPDPRSSAAPARSGQGCTLCVRCVGQ